VLPRVEEREEEKGRGREDETSVLDHAMPHNCLEIRLVGRLHRTGRGGAILIGLLLQLQQD